MTDQERLEYARHRIETAFKTLDAAKVLAEAYFWNSSVNRLYYAVFYAVNALPANSGINARSHSGVKSQFTLHFVKSGKLDKKYGKPLAQLYDWRQKGDYESLEEFDAESVLPLFAPVREMINRIEKEIFA